MKFKEWLSRIKSDREKRKLIKTVMGPGSDLNKQKEALKKLGIGMPKKRSAGR